MHNRWVKIAFIAVVALMCIFTAVHIFLVFWGRTLIIQELHNLTGRKVTIGDFRITPPLNLHIKSLNIEGFVKADSILISPSLPSVLFGCIGLNQLVIINPELTYERFAVEAAAPPVAGAMVEVTSKTTDKAIASVENLVKSELSSEPRKKRIKIIPFILKQAAIENGKVSFIDNTVGTQGIRITIKDINFKLSNLYLMPRSAVAKFDLEGKIPWKEGQDEGAIDLDGWINLYDRDMLASLKITKIDGVYLYPYYSQWVDLEKARIDSAKLNFTSEVSGLKNNVTAQCHLELTDIVRKPRPLDEQVEQAEKIADTVIDIFRTLNQGKIVLDFTIRTKMDRPEFGFDNIKMAFQDQINKGSGLTPQRVMGLPAEFAEGAFKGLANLTSAVIGGTISGVKKILKTTKHAVLNPPPKKGDVSVAK